MGIFTALLGNDDQDRRYYLLQSSTDAKDVVVVAQDKPGRIGGVCLCGPSQCDTPWEVYQNIKLAGFNHNRLYDKKPQVGGEIEAFLNAQEELTTGLDSYYSKKDVWKDHCMNDHHYKGKPAKLRSSARAIRAEIAKLEAQVLVIEVAIPEAEESVRKHEMILAEGAPSIPVIDVVRLETLLVEGPEKQRLLFPETTK